MASFGSVGKAPSPEEEEQPSLQTLAADGNLEALQIFFDSITASKSTNSSSIVNLVDDSGLSPLASAASYGHAAVVSFLLSVGARCDIQDEDGDTALHVCYNAECALLLLACDDCNLTKANNEGLTAEQVHQQELTELINSTTVISIHMNENGSDPPTTTQENTAEQDPETMADIERLRLLSSLLGRIRTGEITLEAAMETIP
jgi:ankyrin repeat protein